VADTLSRRSHVSQLVVDSMPFELCEFDKLNLRIIVNTKDMEMEVGSSLHQEIQRGQPEDEKIQEIKCNINEKNHLVSQRMMKVCCGIRGGIVYLTSMS
jgi:hypothetical protein